MMECALCGEEMEDYQSNNPYPFVTKDDGRVCISCNDFVTAIRIHGAMTGLDPHHIHTVQNIITTAFGMRKARIQSMEYFNKMREEE